MRCLSFDIECELFHGFPKPGENRVITIGIILKSLNTTGLHPLDKASMPIAPLPAYKSNTLKSSIFPNAENIASLILSLMALCFLETIALTKVDITTLDKTHDDPLAKKLRNELKQNKIDIRKIKVVTSNEVPLKDRPLVTSMMFVPSAAGLLLARSAIESILKKGD